MLAREGFRANLINGRLFDFCQREITSGWSIWALVGPEPKIGFRNACWRHYPTQIVWHGKGRHVMRGRCVALLQNFQRRLDDQERADCADSVCWVNGQCCYIEKHSYSISFICPSKSEEYVRAGVSPFRIDGIENPTTLETKLLDEDGRIAKSQRPNGNAFKSIRIIRKNEDIGSLFDVRMSAFDKLQGKGN